MKQYVWKPVTLGLLSLVLLVAANNASAVWEWGCFTCRSSYIPTKPDTFCKAAKNGGSGDGIQCDDEFGICQLKGGSCYNTVVTPGGGGWGGTGNVGGGGGLGCTIYGFGDCPLNCGTCTVVLF